MRNLLVALVLLVSASASAAQAPPPAPASNPEMLRLFKADQDDRKTGPNIDWKVVAPRDQARREATRKLLTDGALTTAEDYQAAAFVFQHGTTAEDYLLAHTLAMVAVSKGEPKALWIASATLDRYLIKIGQKQIYGTQYALNDANGGTWGQEPYDRALVSDALRRELRVPDQAKQLKQLEAFRAEHKAKPGS
jgi:hypothetical protein